MLTPHQKCYVFYSLLIKRQGNLYIFIFEFNPNNSLRYTNKFENGSRKKTKKKKTDFQIKAFYFHPSTLWRKKALFIKLNVENNKNKKNVVLIQEICFIKYILLKLKLNSRWIEIKISFPYCVSKWKSGGYQISLWEMYY